MPGPDELIGDAEREREVDRLRKSTADGRLTLDEFADRVGEVYAARTYAEVTRPTADLPALPSQPRLPARASAVGILSGSRQTGRWRPARTFDAVAVFGSVQVDLCDAVVEDDLMVRAWAVFGGVEVLVPEGVHVDFGGFAIAGGRDYKVRKAPPREGMPVIRVDTRAVFGGVTVRTRPFTSPR